MKTTLGAVAQIKVSDPRLLDCPLLHSIPSAALVQRLRLFVALEACAWTVSRL